MRPSTGFLLFPQGQKGVCGLADLDVSHFDGDLRCCQALLDVVQRLSRLWCILEVDCADAQREVTVRCSEVKGGGGEVRVGL